MEDDDFFQTKHQGGCFEMEEIAEDPELEVRDDYWSEQPAS